MKPNSEVAKEKHKFYLKHFLYGTFSLQIKLKENFFEENYYSCQKQYIFIPATYWYNKKIPMKIGKWYEKKIQKKYK